MLSSVLRSKRKIQVNIQQRLDQLERKYDAQFKVVFDALRKLMTPPVPLKCPIGFQIKERRSPYIIIKRPA
jgi:hypothetical protein